MTDRKADIDAFLADTHWASWQRVPLAGDASSRKYLRLHHGEETVILMDANPALGLTTADFQRVGNWLRDQGLAAPETLKKDTVKGLLLIEDLGGTDMASRLRHTPEDAENLYTRATDVLIKLDGTPTLSDLLRMTPDVGGQMLDVTMEWYAANKADARLCSNMTKHLGQLCGEPSRVALRDYHAENLIWRPHLRSHAQIGLLDYQDAFIAPRGYDLVSLLRDVRRVVDPEICAAMTAHFENAVGPLQPGAFACLAVQRNLRILGVFARLARREGKLRYMQMIPHLWQMIAHDLQHPALNDLAATVRLTLPPPDKSAIKDLL